MKPETGNLSNKVGRGLRTRRCPSLKSLTQVSALAVIALSMTSCVTVGYDFVRQQATVTVNPPPKGHAK
jgi:hypothetical protein